MVTKTAHDVSVSDAVVHSHFKREICPQGEIAATARDLLTTKVTLEDELASILPNEYEVLAIPSDRSSEGLMQGDLWEGVPM